MKKNDKTTIKPATGRKTNYTVTILTLDEYMNGYVSDFSGDEVEIDKNFSVTVPTPVLLQEGDEGYLPPPIDNSNRDNNISAKIPSPSSFLTHVDSIKTPTSQKSVSLG